MESTWVYDLRKDEWVKLTRMSQGVVVFSFLFSMLCCGCQSKVVVVVGGGGGGGGGGCGYGCGYD